MHIIICNDTFAAMESVEADRMQTGLHCFCVLVRLFWVFVCLLDVDGGRWEAESGVTNNTGHRLQSKQQQLLCNTRCNHPAAMTPESQSDTATTMWRLCAETFWVHSAFIWRYMNKTCVETTFKGHHLPSMVYLCCAVIQTPTWWFSGCCGVISLRASLTASFLSETCPPVFSQPVWHQSAALRGGERSWCDWSYWSLPPVHLLIIMYSSH